MVKALYVNACRIMSSRQNELSYWLLVRNPTGRLQTRKLKEKIYLLYPTIIIFSISFENTGQKRRLCNFFDWFRLVGARVRVNRRKSDRKGLANLRTYHAAAGNLRERWARCDLATNVSWLLNRPSIKSKSNRNRSTAIVAPRRVQ